MSQHINESCTKSDTDQVNDVDRVKKEAISGVIRTAAFTIIGRLTTLIAIFATGKLLPREAFAIYAFCYSLSALFAGIGRGCIANLLLQKPKLFHRLKHPATIYSLALNSLGVIISLTLITVTNRLFNLWECWMVGLTLAVRALLMTPITIYVSQISSSLAFKELTNVRIVSVTLKNTLSILMAFLGCGVHALSVPLMLCTVYEALSFRHIAKIAHVDKRITFQPSKRVRGWVFKSSRWLIAITLLTAGMMNVDYFVVGQIGTAEQLAAYYFAFQLTASVLEILISGIQTVTIPVLVALKEQRQNVGESIIRAAQVLNLIGLPTGIALAIVVGPAIWLLWGNKWLDAIACAEFLALAVVPRSLISLLNSSLDASGAWSTRAFLLIADILGIGLVTYLGIISGGITYIGLYILYFNCLFSIFWCVIIAREFNIPLYDIVRSNTTNLAIITTAALGKLTIENLLPHIFKSIPFASSYWWTLIFLIQVLILCQFEKTTLRMVWSNTHSLRQKIMRFKIINKFASLK
jgi:O-antigen/teichoic acid export membrane protein